MHLVSDTVSAMADRQAAQRRVLASMTAEADGSTVQRDVVAYAVAGILLGLLFGVLLNPGAGIAAGLAFALVGVGYRQLRRRAPR